MNTRCVAFVLLLVAGCDLEPIKSRKVESATMTTPTNAPDGKGARKPPELSELSDKSQVTVEACEYVIRNHLKSGSEIVIFASLSEGEMEVLTSRLSGRSLRSKTLAELDEVSGDLRDKHSKEIGAELKITELKVSGDEARVLVLWASVVTVDLWLRKGNAWYVEKSSKGTLNRVRPGY